MDNQQPKKEYDKDNYVATISTVVEKVANLKESQDKFHSEMKEAFRDLKTNYSDRINKLEESKTDKEYTDKVTDGFEARMRVLEKSAIDKTYYDNKHDELVKQVDTLKISEAVVAGKASQFSVWIAYGISLIGFLIEIYLKKL